MWLSFPCRAACAHWPNPRLSRLQKKTKNTELKKEEPQGSCRWGKKGKKKCRRGDQGWARRQCDHERALTLRYRLGSARFNQRLRVGKDAPFGAQCGLKCWRSTRDVWGQKKSVKSFIPGPLIWIPNDIWTRLRTSKVQAGVLSCVRWNEKLLVEQQELQVPRGARGASRHANKRVSEESFPGARESAQFQGEMKSRVKGSASNPDYTQEWVFFVVVVHLISWLDNDPSIVFAQSPILRVVIRHLKRQTSNDIPPTWRLINN